MLDAVSCFFDDARHDKARVFCRTVARKSSIGGLYVCAGGLTFVQGT